ncbi:MAG TPA: carboxypeptidase-like regulatory domain-containing protein, partial [Candidatus Sulfotelmatobacter sp.]|nr:carboxypeptidase-like regulatory domain-containing protein [Candidatus Sulfotelmatobacter sp.]
MKSYVFRSLYRVLVFTTLVFAASFTLAQGIVTGSISGVVEDPQGAVVTNAKVTVTHIATNRVFTTETTSAGIIALRDLPTGAYNLKIEAPNFRAFESTNLVVSVGKDTGMGTVQLTLGSSTETVTVEGAAPLIESTTDQISDTFSSEKVTSIPMGNSFDSLALFLP